MASDGKPKLLTELTTYTFVQQMIDGPNLLNEPKEIQERQLKNLEMAINQLIFGEDIWLVKSMAFGTGVEIKIPEVVETLIKEKVIKVYEPEFCSDTPKFLMEQCKELKSFNST